MNIFACFSCVIFVVQLNTFSYAAPVLPNIHLDIFNVIKAKAKNHDNEKAFDVPFIPSAWKSDINTKKKPAYSINILDRDSSGNIHSYSYSWYQDTKENIRGSSSDDQLGGKRRRHANKRLKRPKLNGRQQEDETHLSSGENFSRSFRSKKSSTVQYDVRTVRREMRGKQKETRNTRRLLMQSRTMQDYENGGDDDGVSIDDDYMDDDYPDEDDNFYKGANSEKIDWKKYLKEDGPSIMELFAVNSRFKNGKLKSATDEYNFQR